MGSMPGVFQLMFTNIHLLPHSSIIIYHIQQICVASFVTQIFGDLSTVFVRPVLVVSDGTISWRRGDSNEPIDVTVMDVTDAHVFYKPAGQDIVIPEEYITPSHKYHVTVTGMTSELEGKAEFRAGEMLFYSLTFYVLKENSP